MQFNPLQYLNRLEKGLVRDISKELEEYDIQSGVIMPTSTNPKSNTVNVIGVGHEDSLFKAASRIESGINGYPVKEVSIFDEHFKRSGGGVIEIFGLLPGRFDDWHIQRERHLPARRYEMVVDGGRPLDLRLIPYNNGRIPNLNRFLSEDYTIKKALPEHIRKDIGLTD